MQRFTNREILMAFILVAIVCTGFGVLISGGHKEAYFSAEAVSSEELNIIQNQAVKINQLQTQNQNLLNVLQAVVNDLNAIPDSLKHRNVKAIIQSLTQGK